MGYCGLEEGASLYGGAEGFRLLSPIVTGEAGLISANPIHVGQTRDFREVCAAGSYHREAQEET